MYYNEYSKGEDVMSKQLKNKERRYNAIVDAGEKLLLERSADSVQMQDIAKEAGLGVATLFRYFPQKQTLIIAVADKILSTELDFYRAISQKQLTGIEKIEAVFQRANRLEHPELLKRSKFIDIFESNIDDFEEFQTAAADYFAIRNEISNIVSDIVEKGQADQTLPSGEGVTDEIMTMINNYNMFARKLALIKNIMALEKNPSPATQLKIMHDMYMSRLKNI